MRIEAPTRITPAHPSWPEQLTCIGQEAPDSLELFGNLDLLQGAPIALFCSIRAPGRVIVESYDVGTALARSGGVVVGGFHSPLEREILEDLLRGSAGVIVCPARSLKGMSIRRRWWEAHAEGRVLFASSFSHQVRRATSQSAERRNILVAALASRVFFLHAAAGGRLSRLARDCAARGVPLHCLDHPANEDLRLLGATPLPPVGF